MSLGTVTFETGPANARTTALVVAFSEAVRRYDTRDGVGYEKTGHTVLHLAGGLPEITIDMPYDVISTVLNEATKTGNVVAVEPVVAKASKYNI
jgi:hypothetical protein